MKAPETNSSNGLQMPSDHKISPMLEVYRIHLDVWKVQNDNYFKRIQIVMIAIQAMLFAAFLKLLSDREMDLFLRVWVIAFLALAGAFSAYGWIRQHNKQGQYLEFCRRMLRNLEHELVKLGIPLRYFTLEAQVFGPPYVKRKKVPKSAGTETRIVGENRAFAKFVWAKERYPDRDTKNKRAHELARVGGPLKECEKKIAFSILIVWVLILLIAIIISWRIPIAPPHCIG